MIMKNQLLNLKMIALMCLMMVLGGANVWAQESFNKTYSYGLSDWQLTNYEGKEGKEGKDAYYLVPKSGTKSVATIPGIFQGKIINSDVVIIINCATYGSGTNPKASTFTVFNSSDCGTAVKSTQSGKLPTSSTYTDVVYTIKSTDVSLLTNDLAIKITKPGKQIRLKSISVKFSFESNANSYSVAWNVNGKAYTEGTPTTKVFEGKKVTTLPTTPENINGKVFVGWTSSEIAAEQNDAPSVLFTDAADAPKVTGDVTYYAVFAKRAGDGKVTYTKLTSNQFKTNATYVIGAESKKTGSIDYFYKYEDVNTDCWGKMTSDLSVNSPIVFVLSGTADKLMAKDNNGNYLKCVSKNFQMSSTEASIKLNTDGTLLDVTGESYWLRYNSDGDYGLRWYAKDKTIGNLAYFYEVSGGYTYSGYCTTVGAAAKPTYTPATVNFVAYAGAYYATFSNAKVVFMPKNVTVQTVTVESNKITFTTNVEGVFGDPATVNIEGTNVAGYYIPANTGVLLESNDKTVTYYTVDNIGNTGYVDGFNMLQPAPTNGGLFTAEPGKVYYKLAYNDYKAQTGLGFYWGADNGGKFFVKAGTAYLAVPASESPAKGFTLNGEATGIDGVNANVENAKAIYNLNGQRVASMAKPGLYIVNGKKVVRK